MVVVAPPFPPRRAEAAIKQGASGLKQLQQLQAAALGALTQADYTGQALLQLKKQSLVLDYIHYLDMVETLLKEHTTSVSEWAWTRQLRYYHRSVSASADRPGAPYLPACSARFLDIKMTAFASNAAHYSPPPHIPTLSPTQRH